MTELLLDTNRKRAVQSLKTDGDKQLANPSSGEVLQLSVARLLPLSESVNQRLWQPQDWAGWTNVQAAVGRGFLAPVAGTFTITFTAQDTTVQTTAALPFNATANQVQTALNALAKIVAAGSVTVTGGASGYYFITFGSNGPQNLFTGDTTLLVPQSLFVPGMLVTGSLVPAVPCIQSIRVMQNPAALAALDTPSAAVSITADPVTVGGAGLNHKVRVTISPKPYDGSWTLALGGEETVFISYNATADEVVTALEGLTGVGAGNVSVNKESDFQWLIMFIGAHADQNMGEVDADANGVKVIPYLTGNLDMRTASIAMLFNGEDLTTAVLAVEGTSPDGYPSELFRATINLQDAIIDPLSLPAVLAPGFTGVNFRITAAGKLQFKNEDHTTKFHDLYASGDDAAVSLDVAQVGVV